MKIIKALLVLSISAMCTLVTAATFEQAAHNYNSEKYDLAAQQFLELAELGNKDAQYSLGVMALNGLGVKHSGIDAYNWFKLAASRGDATASEQVAMLKEHMSETQLTLADSRYGELIARYGDRAVANRLYPNGLEGDVEGGTFRRARPLVKVAAKYPISAARRGLNGTVVIEYTVGTDGRTMHHKVISFTSDVFVSGAVEAVRAFIYEPATLDGVAVEAPAHKNRFTYEMAGSVVKADELFDYLQELKDKAEAGGSVSRYQYALHSATLEKYLSDEQKATLDNPNKWFRLSAVDGLSHAKFELGRNISYGLQCELDKTKGGFWLASAAADGLLEAKLLLGKIKYLNTDLTVKEEGVALIKEASEAGLESAIIEYARILLLPETDQAPNPSAAMFTLQQLNEKNVVDAVSYYEALLIAAMRLQDNAKISKYTKKLKKEAKKLKLPWETLEQNVDRQIAGEALRPLKRA